MPSGESARTSHPGRQEARQFAPVGTRPRKGANRCSASSIEWSTDGSIASTGVVLAPAPLAIGAQQFVEIEPPHRRRDGGQAFRRAAQEDIIAKPRAGHQPAAGDLHRLEQLQPMPKRPANSAASGSSSSIGGCGSSRRDFR